MIHYHDAPALGSPPNCMTMHIYSLKLAICSATSGVIEQPLAITFAFHWFPFWRQRIVCHAPHSSVLCVCMTKLHTPLGTSMCDINVCYNLQLKRHDKASTALTAARFLLPGPPSLTHSYAGKCTLQMPA